MKEDNPRLIAFDTETERFRPGCMAPELACMTTCEPHTGQPLLWHWTEIEDCVRHWLREDDVILTGANTAYDTACLCSNFPDLIPDIFEAYDRDQITCIQLREQLIDNADGCLGGKWISDDEWIKLNYSLADIARRRLGIQMEKGAVRTSFGPLRGLPLDQWPLEAKLYAMCDAKVTLDIHLQQEDRLKYLDSQWHEARSQFFLQLMSVHGIRTDGEMVRCLEVDTMAKKQEVFVDLVQTGLVRTNGTKDTKAAKVIMEKACEALGKTVRRTKKGGVSLDSDACEYSEEPILEAYSEYATFDKVISNDVKMLHKGTDMPVHSRFRFAASSRTRSASPNLQNLRRMPGIRECFRPRPGMVFIDADYNALELWSLAQTCLYLFDKSVLAETLNSGKDPHTALAADILGISYEVAVERKKHPADDKEFFQTRQVGKVANFGFPGGLGPKAFLGFAKKGYDVTIHPDPEQALRIAKELREAWFARWPEMVPYFEHVNMVGGCIEIPVTHMVRGGCSFTETANTYFQALGAAAAKRAGWLITKACYVDRESPLYGSRNVNFIHDQYLTETPDRPEAHEAAVELARLMQEGARWCMPDCVPGVEPLLARCWSKNAVPTKDEKGRLIPWEAKTEAKTK